MCEKVPTYLFLLSLPLFFTPQAWARLGVEPRLAASEQYDDNITLSPDDERSDFITTVRPELALRWEARHFTLDLDYGFKFLFYRDHPEFDETSVNDTQRALASAEFLPGRKFSINVLDEYRRIPIDLRRPTVETNSIVNMSNANRFLLNPHYRLGKLPALQATIGYHYEELSYESPEGDDYNRHSLTLELVRELSSRLKLTLDMAQLYHQAEINEDFRRQDLAAGFNFKVWPRLTLRGDGGVSWIDIKEGEDETAILWSAEADLQITPRISLGLKYDEDFSVLNTEGLSSNTEGLFSNTAGLSKTRLAESTLGYGGKVKAVFSVIAREDDYRSVDRKDRRAEGALSFRIPVKERLDLLLDGKLVFLEFLPVDEDVRRVSAGAGLEYRRKILTITLGYGHHESRSDLDGNNEYSSNIVYLAARVRFWRSLTDYQESQIYQEPQIIDEQVPFWDYYE